MSTSNNCPFAEVFWFFCRQENSLIKSISSFPKKNDQSDLSKKTEVVGDSEKSESNDEDNDRTNHVLDHELEQIANFGIHRHF